MGVPEDFQELFEGDDVGAEGDADDFCVSGASCGYLFVGWVDDMPARVSGFYVYDTGYALVDGFNTPEASCSEGG